MALHRILADLFDHSGKIVAAVLVLGGVFVWFNMPATHAVSTLHLRLPRGSLPGHGAAGAVALPVSRRRFFRDGIAPPDS